MQVLARPNTREVACPFVGLPGVYKKAYLHPSSWRNWMAHHSTNPYVDATPTSRLTRCTRRTRHPLTSGLSGDIFFTCQSTSWRANHKGRMHTELQQTYLACLHANHRVHHHLASERAAWVDPAMGNPTTHARCGPNGNAPLPR